MGWLAMLLAAVIAVPPAIWAAEVAAANWIARRDFGPVPCWFVPEPAPMGPPNLVAGPRGVYVPKPLVQINRAWLGIGVDESAVRAPHFAVARMGADGRPELWAWSYRRWRFWSLTEASVNRGGALMAFVSDEELAACLKAPR